MLYTLEDRGTRSWRVGDVDTRYLKTTILNQIPWKNIFGLTWLSTVPQPPRSHPIGSSQERFWPDLSGVCSIGFSFGSTLPLSLLVLILNQFPSQKQWGRGSCSPTMIYEWLGSTRGWESRRDEWDCFQIPRMREETRSYSTSQSSSLRSSIASSPTPTPSLRFTLLGCN